MRSRFVSTTARRTRRVDPSEAQRVNDLFDKRLAEQAERLSVGEHGAEEIVPEGTAEFRKLALAINRLHRSLMLSLRDADGPSSPTKTKVKP